MRRSIPARAAALAVAAFLLAPLFAQDIEIPFKRFVLANGLTLIVHEDHKAPIVAVNVWYHVGSKNERPGKTGFAHLFEHLMFGGSEHFQGRYIDALERIGATDLNGTTNEDRTNFFERRANFGSRLYALDGIRPHGLHGGARSIRRPWTCSAAWCKTRSARMRTSHTGWWMSRSITIRTRRAIPIPGT